MLFFQQRSFIYHPDQSLPDKDALGISHFVNDVQILTQDRLTLRGWFIPPSSTDKPVILFFHGNAGNISHRLSKIIPYTKAGYGILLAEYRGYGGNPSSPTEDGLYNDARAYYAWLGKRGYSGRDIVLYGESLGSGVAVQMAMEHSPRALILETPYAKLSDPAQRRYFFIPFIEILMHDTFRSIDKIGNIQAPKLFMIAERDEVLGPDTGLNLYEAAMTPKTLKVFQNAGHNEIYNHGATETVLDFLSASGFPSAE